MTIDVLRPVAKELYDDEGVMYRSTATTEYTAFLQVAWEANPETGALTTATIYMFDEIRRPDQGMTP